MRFTAARRLAGALLAAALSASEVAVAQGEVVGGGADPLERLPSTIRGELPRSHLTVLGVVVGRDSLADVETLLGAAPRFSPGGTPGLTALCYESEDAEQDGVVLFQADAKDPQTVVLMAHATQRNSLGGMARRCEPSPALAGGVSNAAGVTLGMSHDDFIARFLHPPSEDHARYAGFYFYDLVELRADAGPRDDCQLLSGVRVRTRLGRTSAFTVYRFYRGRGC
jgi:hypothetical protein